MLLGAIQGVDRGVVYIPRPLCNPPPCNPRPPPPSLHCFARQYLLRWFVFPICHTHVLALLSHYFKSVTCVYSGVVSLFQTQDVFLPVTVYGTT